MTTDPQAVILTIGTELTEGRVADTNTSFLAADLERRGVRVSHALTVSDNRQEIGRSLRFALEDRPALIVLAGGLGPTEDDLTAQAVAASLGLEMKRDAAARRFVSEAVREGELKPYQEKQAMLPDGSEPLRPAGTAPGFLLRSGASLIVAFPGVPSELKAMWEGLFAHPEVAQIIQNARVRYRDRLNFYGVGEPRVGEAAEAILGKAQVAVDVSICSRRGEVLLEAVASRESKDQVQHLIANLKERFSDFVYSAGAEVEAVLAERLRIAGKTLAVGESCTGGMLGEAITRVPGASAFFLGGVVAYSNDVKRTLLKVRQETLDNAGAVSEPVAQQLALGVRALAGADYGAGITGVAGPEGGTPEKPVGLVFICASSDGGDIVRRFDFRGERADIREASVTAALHMLLEKLAADGIGGGDDAAPSGGEAAAGASGASGDQKAS